MEVVYQQHSDGLAPRQVVLHSGVAKEGISESWVAAGSSTVAPRSGENSTGAVGVLSSLGEVARRDAGLHRQEQEVTSAELGMRRGSECMEPGGQHMGMEPVEYIAQAEECLAALQGVRSSPEARG